jgi:hypothetical protein
MKSKNTILNVILSISFLALLTSCNDDAMTKREAQGSFFPMENAREWIYQRELRSTDGNATLWLSDTIRLQVNGDTTVEGKKYKKIVTDEGEIQKIVRVEGSQYFGRNHELYLGYSTEYMFLDTEQPVGSSWTYLKDGGASKTEYVIIAKTATQNFLGRVYKDVIEVEVTYYLYSNEEYSKWLSTKHFYAKGVGEIYNYYPYPVSKYYADLSSFIINTNISK